MLPDQLDTLTGDDAVVNDRDRETAFAAEVAIPEWTVEVDELLLRAAQLVGAHGGDLEVFVNGAYRAFLVTNPDARARLAEARLLAELELMRQAGRLGQA